MLRRRKKKIGKNEGKIKEGKKIERREERDYAPPGGLLHLSVSERANGDW